MQEIETLSVHDIPRSASSLSVRTDASGTAVNIEEMLVDHRLGINAETE